MGCPYRKGALNCYKSDHCVTCGWNPEVEQERIAKLRSGEVKTYLIFDKHLSTLLHKAGKEGPFYEDEERKVV